MAILYFIGLNPKGELHEFTIGAPDIESALELLTILVNAGCQLSSVRLVVDTNDPICLPVEAFDGEPMKKPLQLLQREWEEILS